jgi:hypothetical protein
VIIIDQFDVLAAQQSILKLLRDRLNSDAGKGIYSFE